MKLTALNIPPGLRIVLTLGDEAAARGFAGDLVTDPVRVQVIDDRGVMTSMELSRSLADLDGATELVQALLDGRARPRLVR